MKELGYGPYVLCQIRWQKSYHKHTHMSKYICKHLLGLVLLFVPIQCKITTSQEQIKDTSCVSAIKFMLNPRDMFFCIQYNVLILNFGFPIIAKLPFIFNCEKS